MQWQIADENTMLTFVSYNTLSLLAPPNVTWISPKQSIAEPFKASFFCNVTGSEPMKVEWRKAGSVAVLANGTNFTIGSILRSQEGTYEVTASNGHECPIKQSSAYVDVLCK